MQIIKHYKVADLVPYEHNNKIHTEDAIDKLVESIHTVGYSDPIEIDKNNVIIAGHKRRLALLKMGVETVDVIKHENLTASQSKYYRLANNVHSEQSEWNNDNYRLEYDELKIEGFAVDKAGFNDFLHDFEIETDIQDDDFDPELPEETYIKNGDIVELGKHKIICSTGLEETADFIFTDPPYEIDLKEWCKAVVPKDLLLMCTFKQAIDVINNSPLDFRFDLVWNQHTPSSMLNKKVPYYLHKTIIYLNQNDLSVFNCDNAKGYFSEKGYYPSIIDAPKNTQEKHGLTKNSKAMTQMLSGFSFDKCLDPFIGSGTTLIACENLNRICIGYEINPKYVQVIIERSKAHCEQNNIDFTCKINGDRKEI